MLAGLLNIAQTTSWLPIGISCIEYWYATEGSYTWILPLFVFFVYCRFIGDQLHNIYAKYVTFSPYILSLTVFFGFFHYGIQGIMYAPMLVSLIHISVKVVREMNFDLLAMSHKIGFTGKKGNNMPYSRAHSASFDDVDSLKKTDSN